ncbi:lipoate--protein ligase [Arthrobacter sp. H5]|uniref:lipoyl protein ligase domain-containing protein n=1 Tax=Arthrobacter sp. H5 TaxID=1267973 RepID=UPI00047F7EEE|nr:lipoate--protein ligase [Arthrobacter sp. H5]
MSAWSQGSLQVIHQDLSAGAAADLDRGIKLLRDAAAGTIGPTLRLYRPQPTMAFGQRDARLAGFDAAARAARSHGFEPLVRRAGGRAAAYHRGCLIVDHIEPHTDAIAGSRERFSLLGALLAEALRRVGVDAAVGEIPGEYCPGEFSVHGNGATAQLKLVGTAQRVIAGAWLFSSVIVVENSAPIRAVLEATYAALDLNWDPLTAGAVEDLTPGVSVEDVAAAVVAVYSGAARRAAGSTSGSV